MYPQKFQKYTAEITRETASTFTTSSSESNVFSERRNRKTFKAKTNGYKTRYKVVDNFTQGRFYDNLVLRRTLK